MDTITTSNELKYDTNVYYKCRSIIKDLYINESYYGDLAGELLKYRDNNKNINSISINIGRDKNSNTIIIELSENKTMYKVINDISIILSNYIKSASQQLNLSQEEMDQLYDYIDRFSLYDVYTVGNEITFNL